MSGNETVIKLNENAVYIVKGGNITKITPKDYGKDIIFWKNGEVLDVDRSQRLRIKGQDSI